jgi:hypothetical protein
MAGVYLELERSLLQRWEALGAPGSFVDWLESIIADRGSPLRVAANRLLAMPLQFPEASAPSVQVLRLYEPSA